MAMSFITRTIDKAVAYSANIGTFGNIIFETNDTRILNPLGLQRTGGSDWATQSLVKGKPRSQYMQPKLRTVTFSIKLNSQHGVKPRAMLDELMTMAEGFTAYRLVINGKPLSDLPWILKEVSESWGHMYNRGELVTAEVSLTLEEYR